MIIETDLNMGIKKLNKFLFVISSLFLFACNNTQSENLSIITSNLSLVNKTDMTLVNSTNENLIFLDSIKINKIKYLVKCVYKNDYDYPFFQLIKNEDTIEFEKDELYVTDSIYDINNDNIDDFNIIYQATRGFIIFSYLFDKEVNKLRTKPILFTQQRLAHINISLENIMTQQKQSYGK